MAVTVLAEKLSSKTAHIGVIGLGYVGLPLSLAACHAGFKVTGFDVDADKILHIKAGKSYIRHIGDGDIARFVTAQKLDATVDFSRLAEMDVIVICVPTPLNKHREPDLSYVENTARLIAPCLRSGQLVVLESTTWPGTTREIVLPILAETGLQAGRDFFLAFSPEREDPGNISFTTSTIPKVVGADDAASRQLVADFYRHFIAKVVPVSSAATAEAVKLTENIFRSVNIALVNELKIVYDAMGIDVWEVIDAAKTKPFGFMPFYPGPGLGGHCIPIDPFYLTWKAREYDIHTRFIELAGEINTAMPRYVIDRTAQALSDRFGKALKGARALVLGVAYKKNVDDQRESPSFRIIEMLEARGAQVDFHDPILPVILPSREHPHLTGRQSVAVTAENLATYDVVLVITDHDVVDYAHIVAHSRLVIDTRNATRSVLDGAEKLVRA